MPENIDDFVENESQKHQKGGGNTPELGNLLVAYSTGAFISGGVIFDGIIRNSAVEIAAGSAGVLISAYCAARELIYLHSNKHNK